MYLSELFDSARVLNGPSFFVSKSIASQSIGTNFAPFISVRDYQHEAIGRLLYYTEDFSDKKNPTHLLFNMATGSGKTLVMAASMLQYYKLGYRNFVFVTRLSSIVDKTRDNFIAKQNSKYLFAPEISIHGSKVEIQEVQNFQGGANENIRIVFTTTAALHRGINTPSENTFTLDDFENEPVVIIADEAHNLSGQTLSRTEAEDDRRNWEQTVKFLHHLNARNVLLEFTATARLEDADARIVEKYQDVLIYKYTLKEMRNAGYSKNVNTLQIDSSLANRVLAAMIMSTYRALLASNNGVNLKPIILFKANRIFISDQVLDRTTDNPTFVGSKNFSDFFKNFVSSLTATDLSALRAIAAGDVLKAIKYLDTYLTDEAILAELKLSFSDEKCFSVDISSNDPDSSRLLNTLEETSNPIRAVVATEKLNEGWDVLNLFDIVRLYDSRDAARNKAGKNTIQEAQLIGRGARYWPFIWGDGSASATRRFDHDRDFVEFQILERLTYHSMRNPRYIQELEQALIQQGLLAEKMIQRELIVKSEVKNSSLWQNTVIYSNSVSRFDSDTPDLLSIGLPARCRFIEISLPSAEMTEREVFSERQDQSSIQDYIVKELLGEKIESRFWLSALDRNQLGTFDSLAYLLPKLASRKDFIESKLYLGGVSIKIHGLESQLSALSEESQFVIATKVVSEVLARLSKVQLVGRGSKEFSPVTVDTAFGDTKTLNFDPENPRARGNPTLNLNSLKWFAQNEIWGTSEEYELVSFIDSVKNVITDKWDSFLLIRNEGQVSLFDFDSGQKFNPDFLLILNRTSESGLQEIRQIFIEPKGSQFLDASGNFSGGQEGWKEFFLQSLFENVTIEEDLLTSTSIHGLPFFCSAHGHGALLERFRLAFAELINK